MDKDIVPMVIDFSEIRGDKLNESWLYMFGGWVETILGRMFGTNKVPVTIRGTEREIKSFANTLDKEKSYLQAYKKYGLDNPNTYKNRAKLDSAINDFEKTTNIRWPFK